MFGFTCLMSTISPTPLREEKAKENYLFDTLMKCIQPSGD